MQDMLEDYLLRLRDIALLHLHTQNIVLSPPDDDDEAPRLPSAGWPEYLTPEESRDELQERTQELVALYGAPDPYPQDPHER
jgi:hypothetical protein